jgi:ribosome-binding factor A
MARRQPARGYSRTDRIAETIREIVATELERLDDDRLELVTVTSVKVDNDLNRADVYYSALTAEREGRLDEVTEGLEEVRWRIQKVVNREVRARKTPQIAFHPDDVLLSALHIDDLIEGRVPPPPDEG